MNERLEKEKEIMKKFAMQQPPQVVFEQSCGKAKIEIMDCGTFFYIYNGECIHHAYSCAKTVDGKAIDTKTAQMVSATVADISDEFGEGKQVTAVYEKECLVLTQQINLYKSGKLVVKAILKDNERFTNTRYIAPFCTPYPDKKGKRVFLSLDQKMLKVPYDNDMWMRYESAVPDCGRKSYDVTAIYDEHTLEGLVVGALDFDIWKNAIEWGRHDARTFLAYSGVADAGTHDIYPHEPVTGKEVHSARFTVYWSENIKKGMEEFADMCTEVIKPRQFCECKVPFGWNSFSALGMMLTIDHWKQAGEFIQNELVNFGGEDGVSFINLDGAFGLDIDEIRTTIKEMHEQGKKAGWYASPCMWIQKLGDRTFDNGKHTVSELFLKDYDGNVMPAIDNLVPLDVTHPLWEVYTRETIKELINLNIDYIKIDFLTHASIEGNHYKKGVTGRMALNHAYKVIQDEIGKAEKEVFISLSIAPLFPYFLGNSRRSCCDAFGHYDDVRYVLNALNFAWWTNGRIYQYNDPDHCALYHSIIDGRSETTIQEARSRYIASVISGTVIMLSDNFGPTGDEQLIKNARNRALEIANNANVNEVARFGKTFIPVYLKSDTTPFYTLTHAGRHFVALFNFNSDKTVLELNAKHGNLPENGKLKNLYTGELTEYKNFISTNLDGYDAALFEIIC